MGQPTLSGLGFTILSIASAITAIGVFRRKRWGWWLAMMFVGINALAASGHFVLDLTVANAIGPVVAGAIVCG